MIDDLKFPKKLDFNEIKKEFGQNEQKKVIYVPDIDVENNVSQLASGSSVDSAEDNDLESISEHRPGLTGARLRSYAFAVLTRREYSRADLIKKLSLYAESEIEVLELVDELARENYQSDQRVAEMMVRSQVRKGKGPNRIKFALSTKKIDQTLVVDDLNEIDWLQQAYMLKVKKYGTEVTTDLKLKAKQIRFLQYRGFDMDVIMKVIVRKEED